MAAIKAPAQTDATMKIENTEKRDHLVATEKKYQKLWQDEKVFEPTLPEENASSGEELRSKHPKFFATMAYPYMNGTLHAGHGFTFSKAEFMAGYARLEGKRVLWPLGFHCTGMPIKAVADKIQREVELFGKDFEGAKQQDESEEAEAPAPTQAQTRDDITKFATKKSKAASKTIQAKHQFEIMLSQGIKLEEIHKFADPMHWLKTFPPLAKEHLIGIGARIDWSRSFVTTDANLYYDAFIQWQMRRLKDLSKIKFGKRYTVYSPKDGQACLDHDRSKGEGATPQEYTALKMKVEEWAESAKSKLEGKLPADANVFFVPATLRPETMYGQTSCFVSPKLNYSIIEAGGKDYYFLSDRAARNMAYQGVLPKWGEYTTVAEVQGSDVIGTKVHAPLSVHGSVWILPMDSIKEGKGTTVVTCVPSDSPDDYAMTMDLQKKAEFYGIKKEWVDLEILPIINSPTYGDLIAPAIVKEKKIQSPKDAKALAEAKEIAYKEGFYQGTMIYGEYKGKPVSEAKELVKQQLIDAGLAFNYAEPTDLVISRSNDICVVALLDQWFLTYGDADPDWRQLVLDHVNGELNTYSSDTKNGFEKTLSWLNQWAVSRSYGLGTRLPWDKDVLVESLSDSAIYPSYYTIAHLLHKDIFGKEIGPLNLKPEQMTDAVWDYIFCLSPENKSDVPAATLDILKKSFDYWYPLDVRVSGKDLIQNHLTFFLYIHTAIWSKQYWPRGIRANGHLLLNGEKMSKSTGNFLTIEGAVKKFGADATRLALADAGDGIDDANFEETVANSSILKLFELRKWCEEMISEPIFINGESEYEEAKKTSKVKSSDTIQRKSGSAKNLWDNLFDNEMRSLTLETKSHFDNTDFKLALKSGFYDFTSARDTYRANTAAAGVGMHYDLVQRYVELQALLISVICPHWADYIWREVLKKPESIQNARWPTVEEPVPALSAIQAYVRTTTSNITSAEGAQQKRMAKGKSVAYDIKKDKKLTIFAASKFPDWQEKYINLARDFYNGLSLDVKALTPKIEKPEMKKAMPFVQGLKKRIDSGEKADAVFDRKLPFDEVETLRAMVPGLLQTVQKLTVVEIIKVEQEGKKGIVVAADGSDGEVREDLAPAGQSAVPGNPSFNFENI